MMNSMALSIAFFIVLHVTVASGTTEPFTCVGKVIGGYYADVNSGCQMFHVCTLGNEGVLNDIVFRCLKGTVFEQKTRVCERTEEVDCSESHKFFHLNNELYGPGIIPDTAFVEGKTERKELTEETTWAKTLSTEAISTFSCHKQPRPGFYVDIDLGCEVFHFCRTVDKKSDKQRITYKCSQKNEAFDMQLGKCVPNDLVNCVVTSSENKEISAKEISQECRIIGLEIRVADTTHSCKNYFGCAFGTDGNISLQSWTCEDGTIFSQINQKCMLQSQVQCIQETYPIMKKFSYIEEIVSRVEMGITNPPIDRQDVNLIRKKRSSLFDTQSSHREPVNGPSSGIFSDHSSVIDNQSPGNGLEGRVAVFIPEEKKPSTEEPYPSSHALNKTLVNGTVIEVSEIESPDQSGKVTITSVVPKLVRQNGKGKQTDSEKSETPLSINVATGQSKVTLSGGSSNTVPIGDPEKQVEETTTISMEETTTSMAEEVSTEETTTTPTTTTTTTTPAPTTTTTTTSSPSKPNLSTSAPDEIVETNFTCRDKDLERFYPDIEADCKVFHYCAPGFSDDQVLDLKFLCTGDTRFDSKTSKCQDMSEVKCETPAVPQGLKVSSTTMPTTTTTISSTTSVVTTTTSPPASPTTSSVATMDTSASTTTLSSATTLVTAETKTTSEAMSSTVNTTESLDTSSISTSSPAVDTPTEPLKEAQVTTADGSTQEADVITTDTVLSETDVSLSPEDKSSTSETTVTTESLVSTSKDDNSSGESNTNLNKEDNTSESVSTASTKSIDQTETDLVPLSTPSDSSLMEGSTKITTNDVETSTSDTSSTTEVASNSSSDVAVTDGEEATIIDATKSDPTVEPEKGETPSS